jgi:hypothetical protein
MDVVSADEVSAEEFSADLEPIEVSAEVVDVSAEVVDVSAEVVDVSVDLEPVDLSSMDLVSADLEPVDLVSGDLEPVDLVSGDLEPAEISAELSESSVDLEPIESSGELEDVLDDVASVDLEEGLNEAAESGSQERFISDVAALGLESSEQPADIADDLMPASDLGGFSEREISEPNFGVVPSAPMDTGLPTAQAQAYAGPAGEAASLDLEPVLMAESDGMISLADDEFEAFDADDALILGTDDLIAVESQPSMPYEPLILAEAADAFVEGLQNSTPRTSPQVLVLNRQINFLNSMLTHIESSRQNPSSEDSGVDRF